MPGRWAVPPAPAMITWRPRSRASCAYSYITSGVRCAETMRTWRDLSCGGLSVVQDRETLAVHIDIDLAKPDVVRRRSRHDDR
jgi:hypothetical protein